MTPLASARLKVKRAKEHVRTLNQHVQRWLEGEPHRVRRKIERDGADHIYWIEVFAEAPPYLGTIVGDVAHNLMSALDSIAWDLSGNSIPLLSESDKRSIGFPIAKEAKHYNARPIRFAPPAAKAEVERSQPYHGEIPADSPLWTILELNRVDKHRYTPVIPALVMGSQWVDPGPPYGEFVHPVGALEHSAELARFRFESPQPEVDMQFRPMIDVALGHRAPAGHVLNYLVASVEKAIIPRFEPFFPL